MEAKSFFDSPGVKIRDLTEIYEVPEGRYKLFTCENYREIVLSRLLIDLIDIGMANQDTRITLGLAAGNVYPSDSEKIRSFMKEKQWLYWSPENIKKRVMDLAESGYENDPTIITTKILLR
jgi:hypothetical protein